MRQKPETVSVVVATYNKPAYLRSTLAWLDRQNHRPNQIVVADDGSQAETRMVCEEFTGLRHVWHEDNGFQKCDILNKAIEVCTSDYVIFIDDDCLCPTWFVENHMRVAEKRSFTVGSSVNLSEQVTERLLKGESTFADFLAKPALSKMQDLEIGARGGWLKLFFRVFLMGKPLATLADRIYLGRGVFRGGNSGAWLSDLKRVNGFNNDMVYGHEDREIGERLKNAGCACKQVRYAAVNFHMYHERPYADSTIKESQRAIYRRARSEKIVECKNGLRQVT